MQRAGPKALVWLGDHPCLVRARTSSTLTVDIAGVPAGPHDLYVVDGTRQAPTVPIFITREPGRETWYRVTEVGIELSATSPPTGSRTSSVYASRRWSQVRAASASCPRRSGTRWATT